MGYVTMVWLFGISVMDIRRRNVPVWMLAPGGILAGIRLVCRQDVTGDMLMAMFPGIILLVVALVTKKAGYGDGIVLLFLGILSGGGESLMLAAAGLFFAAVFSLIMLGLRKVRKDTRIPFLPFLAAAWLVVTMV